MPIEFARSARSTVGLEWEIAIVDRATGELASVGDRVLQVLDERSAGGRHPTITSELLTNTVELVSGVHERVAGASSVTSSSNAAPFSVTMSASVGYASCSATSRSSRPDGSMFQPMAV